MCRQTVCSETGTSRSAGRAVAIVVRRPDHRPGKAGDQSRVKTAAVAWLAAGQPVAVECENVYTAYSVSRCSVPR
jgi:hypothetical protein